MEEHENIDFVFEQTSLQSHELVRIVASKSSTTQNLSSIGDRQESLKFYFHQQLSKKVLCVNLINKNLLVLPPHF